MAISGHDLKVKRVQAKVTGKVLARVMSVGPWTLSRIEARDEVDLDTVQRYLAALSTCGTVQEEAA